MSHPSCTSRGAPVGSDMSGETKAALADHDRSLTSTDDALSDGREWSAISKVARGTVTPT